MPDQARGSDTLTETYTPGMERSAGDVALGLIDVADALDENKLISVPVPQEHANTAEVERLDVRKEIKQLGIEGLSDAELIHATVLYTLRSTTNTVVLNKIIQEFHTDYEIMSLVLKNDGVTMQNLTTMLALVDDQMLIRGVLEHKNADNNFLARAEEEISNKDSLAKADKIFLTSFALAKSRGVTQEDAEQEARDAVADFHGQG